MNFNRRVITVFILVVVAAYSFGFAIRFYDKAVARDALKPPEPTREHPLRQIWIYTDSTVTPHVRCYRHYDALSCVQLRTTE
jgi:hypothetical protein